MALELDHIFVCVSRGGEEARAVEQVGLSEGTPNTHLGQGTACRRFFWSNAYLELLWIIDPNEAQSPAVRATHLWERWAGRAMGACPFGLVFRPSATRHDDVPFPTWEYRPAYLPDPWRLHVGTNAHVLIEPMLIYLPFSRRPDAHASRQVLEHSVGFHELTRVELVGPDLGKLSPALEALLGTGLVKRRVDQSHLVRLGFDGESKGRVAVLRPSLPVVFHW